MAQKKKQKSINKVNSKVATAKESNLLQPVHWILLGLTVVLTYLCFTPALTNSKEFTNWDDPVYVTQQELIKKWDAENIKQMFSTKTDVSLNYHPLTMLTLAWNYKQNKLEPQRWFLTNIIIHILNVLLVFVFIFLFTERNYFIAIVTAAWFGIHPMHVESVAWISERKDVLYVFFFLLSCIAYILYLKKNNTLYLIFTFIAFLLSCLSKAMAVVLPLVLLLADVYLKRKMNARCILEKIPFFAVSIFIGLLAVKIQSREAIAEFELFTLWQRFAFAAYGFLMYWIKIFYPLNLSAFYPYPSLEKDGSIPLIYTLSPVIAGAAIAAILFWIHRAKKIFFMTAVTGILFFCFTIALVLQFISVGAALMADRYSYLPYIGAFFMIASALYYAFENVKYKTIVTTAVVGITAFYSYYCYERVKVWQNSETLWTDVINKYPYKISRNGNVITVEQVGVETAYKNRGNYYAEHNMLDSAYKDYKILELAQSKDAGVHTNMGNLYGLKKEFENALNAYSKALEYKPNNFEVHLNRGITYSMMGKFEEALRDYSKAIELSPNDTKVYLNRAYAYLTTGKYKECIDDCNTLLRMGFNDPMVFFYKGTALVNIGNYNEAISELTATIKLNPNLPNAYYNLAMAHYGLKQYRDALINIEHAKKLGYSVEEQSYNDIKSKAGK